MTQRALPRSALGKSIAYTSGLWPGAGALPCGPEDPGGHELRRAGAARRCWSVGRTTTAVVRSAGTRVAALFYSLIESAKLCGVEPRRYLGEAARRAVRNPGTVTLSRDLK